MCELSNAERADGFFELTPAHCTERFDACCRLIFARRAATVGDADQAHPKMSLHTEANRTGNEYFVVRMSDHHHNVAWPAHSDGGGDALAHAPCVVFTALSGRRLAST